MPENYEISAYDYDLPEENIAQSPARKRDGSRLLVLNCRSDRLQALRFRDILQFIDPGDLLVVNDTKVFPARLQGRKESGGQAEFFLLQYPQESPADKVSTIAAGAEWQEVVSTGLLKSSGRNRPGVRIIFSRHLQGLIEEVQTDGTITIRLRYQGSLAEILAAAGEVPLPPYIRRQHGESSCDRARYQTVYARETGAVAAPTAGLHFSETLLSRIRKKGVEIAAVTLHVGYGTFAPVRVRDIRDHVIHREYVSVPGSTAELVNRTREAGGRIWAVGTTTLRSLEFSADSDGRANGLNKWCDLFIYPGYEFRVVDCLLTNFHLPRSSLLFLVAAMAGREKILQSYQEAIRLNYRFYSYGDAMAIIR